MKFKLKIKIIGNKASVFLLDKERNIISKSVWIDERNLSEKLLKKIDLLLRENKLVIKDIEKVDFECDSPYFAESGHKKELSFEASELSSFLCKNSKNKCGFTSWQIGEITTKVLNFAVDES